MEPTMRLSRKRRRLQFAPEELERHGSDVFAKFLGVIVDRANVELDLRAVGQRRCGPGRSQPERKRDGDSDSDNLFRQTHGKPQ